MINYIITLFIMASIVFSIINGNISQLSQAILQASGSALKTAASLAGAMALWGGVMQVAEKSGLTNKIALLLKKPVSLLFPSISSESTAFKTICMNITANILGLGNAATPLGIKAMKHLNNCENKARNMAMLVVLNTSSIQLIPITVAALRMSHGSQTPWDCTFPIFIVSLLSVIAGCIMVSVLYMHGRKK
ncbi:MAG: spore maturation protein A [Ruminococcus sp.]|nr:spore maturation protein A [Ruminococcus sp.]